MQGQPEGGKSALVENAGRQRQEFLFLETGMGQVFPGQAFGRIGIEIGLPSPCQLPQPFLKTCPQGFQLPVFVYQAANLLSRPAGGFLVFALEILQYRREQLLLFLRMVHPHHILEEIQNVAGTVFQFRRCFARPVGFGQCLQAFEIADDAAMTAGEIVQRRLGRMGGDLAFAHVWTRRWRMTGKSGAEIYE